MTPFLFVLPAAASVTGRMAGGRAQKMGQSVEKPRGYNGEWSP